MSAENVSADSASASASAAASAEVAAAAVDDEHQLRARVRADRAARAAATASDGSGLTVDLYVHVYAPVPEDGVADAAACAALRARLAAECACYREHAEARAYCAGDATLRRFLRARKGDARKAYELLVECVEWRVSERPWAIGVDKVQWQLEFGKMQLNGPDVWGRPVLILDQVCMT
jgi:hypothetical protein